jgi:DNA repair exonuclease SbcCD nuclease subunit
MEIDEMPKIKPKLTKTAMFSDIHFGRRNNSPIHNTDCLKFVEWFCDRVKEHKADHVIFLGDFFEQRSSIDTETMDYAIQAFDILDDLGIPVYIIVGNHDMYNKHARSVHSLKAFKEYANIVLVDKITKMDNIGNSGSMLFPYLLRSEYSNLKEYKNTPIWFGHFEISGFYLTGYYKVKLEEGVTTTDFTAAKRVFSGHFHKRQNDKNIDYIGNPFGFDGSDKGDDEKGMAIFEHDTDNLIYINYDDGPRFYELMVSDLKDIVADDLNNKLFKENDSVVALRDIVMSYEDHTLLVHDMKRRYNLRNFRIKDIPETKAALENTEEILKESEIEVDVSADELTKTHSIDELVELMIGSIKVNDIDNDLLLDIYRNTK